MAETNSTQLDSAPAGPARAGAGLWVTLVRLAVSAALMAYLILVVVPEEDRVKIFSLYLQIDPALLLLAAALVSADRLLSAWKWLVLLRVREPRLPAGPVFEVFFVTTFFGLFLPSSIGGDALRAFSLSRINRDLAGSASSVVIDRSYGTLGLLVIAALAVLPELGRAVPLSDAAVIWGVAAAALAGVLLISSRSFHRRLSGLTGLEGGGAIRSRLAKALGAASQYVGRKSTLLWIFLFSSGVQIIRLLIILVLGFALGVRVDPLAYLVYGPLIIVITFLPISIGGVGVREAGFLYFFGALGVPAYMCISLSLLTFSMGLLATLPGAVIYIFTGMGRRQKRSREGG